MHKLDSTFFEFFLGTKRPKDDICYCTIFPFSIVYNKKIPECKKRLWKLSHVVFEDVCNDVGRNVGEVNEVGTIFKCLTQPIDPLFGSRNSVNPLHG